MRLPCCIALGGFLAFSAIGCRSADPALEKIVDKAVVAIEKGNEFPSQTIRITSGRNLIIQNQNTQILYEHEKFKKCIEQNLEKLLTGIDWEAALSYCYEFEIRVESAAKKALLNKNSQFYKTGETGRFIYSCRSAGYNFTEDPEWKAIFKISIINNLNNSYEPNKNISKPLSCIKVSSDIRDFIGLLGKDHKTELGQLIMIHIPLLMERGDFDSVIEFSEEYGIPLARKDCIELANYSLNKPIMRGDNRILRNFISYNLAKKLFVKALKAEGSEPKNEEIVYQLFYSCYEELLEKKKNTELKNILEEYCRLKLPFEEESSNSILKYLVSMEGDNRLKTFIEQGFIPSKEKMKEYCIEQLARGYGFEDVEFFVEKYGNEFSAEKYMNFAEKMIGKYDLNSIDVHYAGKAVELAKEKSKHLNISGVIHKKYSEIRNNTKIDVEAVICFEKALGKDFFSDEIYKSRLKKLANSRYKFTEELAKVFYHMMLRNHYRADQARRELYALLSEVHQPRFILQIQNGIGAEKYLKFLGDLELERGNIKAGYEFWKAAEYKKGVEFIEKKYSQILKK